MPEEVLPFRTVDCPDEAAQLLKQGLVRCVVADVMVAFDTPDSRPVRAAAAGLLIPEAARTAVTGPEWVIGFSSAAWLHTGFTGATAVPDELEVIVPPGRRRPRRHGVRGRQVTLAAEQVTYVGPVAVTDPVRTAADVARDLAAPVAVAALRRLGELYDVRPDDVLQVLASMRYARGAATARQAVRAWADSG